MAPRAGGVSGKPSRPGDDSRSQRRAFAANGASGSRSGALAPRNREARRVSRRSLLAPTRSPSSARRVGGRRCPVKWHEERRRASRAGRQSRLRSAGSGSRRPLPPPRARHAPGGASRASLRAPQRAKARGRASPDCVRHQGLHRSRVFGPLVRGMGQGAGSPRRSPGRRPTADMAATSGLAAARAHPQRRSSGWCEVKRGSCNGSSRQQRRANCLPLAIEFGATTGGDTDASPRILLLLCAHALLVGGETRTTRSQRNYGRPRMLRDLWDLGRWTSRKRVARLMRELGLVGRRRRRLKATMVSKRAFLLAANVLIRDCEVSARRPLAMSREPYFFRSSVVAM